MSCSSIRTLIASVGLVCATLGPSGCAFKPGEIRQVADDENVEVATGDGRGAWLFWPTAIRILPLTRLARAEITADPTVAPTIEVRVEAMDSSGEPSRAVGIFVVSVESRNAVPAVQRWKIDLGTTEAHSQRFDAVTDTYRFDVTPTWVTPPARGTTVNLKVVLYGADGASPAASATITW